MKISTSCVICDSKELVRQSAILMPFLADRIFGWQSTTIDESWALSDVPKGSAVPICTSLACTQCDHLFLDMRFDDDEMSALYDDYRGPAYEQMRERYEPGYAARNAMLCQRPDHIGKVETLIRSLLPARPRVLDWGGDTGNSTPFRGCATLHHVFDISGKPVVEGALAVSLKQIGEQEYDLIVSSNVLEHVSAPRDALGDMSAAMGNDTLLYLELPHEALMQGDECAADRVLRKRHWHEHINFFSEASIDKLLTQAGLELISRASHAVSIADRSRRVFMVLARRRKDPGR